MMTIDRNTPSADVDLLGGIASDRASSGKANIAATCTMRWLKLAMLARRNSSGSRMSPPVRTSRSEEHTSELQSLMRNSYAVFCLKKKTTTEATTPYQQIREQ